jgi:hypothetical protein
MGADALRGNGITNKILYFFRDKNLTPLDEPLRRVRKSRILMFLAVQILAFGATFAITQTIGTSLSEWDVLHTCIPTSNAAAIGFPVIIMLLIPLRAVVIPRLSFTAEELAILDGPAASPFVSPQFFWSGLVDVAVRAMARFSLLTIVADGGYSRLIDYGIRWWNLVLVIVNLDTMYNLKGIARQLLFCEILWA